MISNPNMIGPGDNRVKAKVSSLKTRLKKETFEKIKRKGLDG